MRHSERLRWSLAVLGPLLFLASSFMPLFGGAAKWAHRCQGREFTGVMDDCFNDYLPILEAVVPIVALLLLYPFARMAFSLFAPPPDQRTYRWRLATSSSLSDLFPTLHVFAAIGIAWAGWRAALYPLGGETWPFIAFWLLFANWFSVALVVALINAKLAEPN